MTSDPENWPNTITFDAEGIVAQVDLFEIVNGQLRSTSYRRGPHMRVVMDCYMSPEECVTNEPVSFSSIPDDIRRIFALHTHPYIRGAIEESRLEGYVLNPHAQKDSR